MADRRTATYLLVVLAVFAVAVATRTIPLYWSPLPATLDGIRYAAQARDTIAIGHFPLADLRTDNFVFVGLLSATGLILDDRPLTLAQPLIAVVGAASCVAAVAIVRRFGETIGWSPRRVRIAAVFVGGALAVEGLYLRRTGVPDEEAITLLFLPVLAIAFHRILLTRRYGWGVVTVVLLVVFPLTHTFSTLIAALTITGLVAVHLSEYRSIRTGFLGLILVGGFWIYFAAYYEVAQRTILTVPYVGRVLSHPGLFVAWAIVLVVGAVWFRHASPRSQRAAFLLPLAVWFGVLVANVFAPVFPGTVLSPPLLTAAVLLFVLPVVFASRSVPLLGIDDTNGVVVLALLFAPVIHVYFSLTAELTPEFFATVMRTQTFAHVPVFALASLTVGRYCSGSWMDGTVLVERSTVRFALVTVLVASVVLTAPIAFVDLDTLEYPSTTTREEFAGASFAATHVETRWTTDHTFSRMADHYYRTDVVVAPVAGWLRGGLPPSCPVLAKAAWTRTGAHLFPTAPATIPEEHYEAWVEQRQLVYATTGADSVILIRPLSADGQGC